MPLYAIALGSNRPHGHHGAPARVLPAAIDALRSTGVTVRVVSPIFVTAPVGPSLRAYANAAALIETPLDPPALLALLKATERAFGRRRGQRWGSRVLDLDILLWSGGRWHGRRPALDVPHRLLDQRRFVLDPLATIVPLWRVPRLATVRQLQARLTRPVAAHRSLRRSGP